MCDVKLSLLISVLFAILALVPGCGSSEVPDGDDDVTDNIIDGDFEPDGDLDVDSTEVDTEKDTAEVEEECECKIKCFSTDRSVIDFGSVTPGTCGTQKVQILSTGQNAVTIYNVSIDTSVSSSAFEVVSFSEETPVEVLPFHYLEVEVGYCPEQLQEDTGKLAISSDSDCVTRLDVDLIMDYKGEAVLEVTPDKLDWGTKIADGSTYYQSYTLKAIAVPEDANRPLEISTLSLDVPNGKFALVDDPGCVPPFFLSTGSDEASSRTCRVSFIADGEGDFSDTLRVTATDYKTPEQSGNVDLSARSELGKIVVDTESINFNYILVNKGSAQEPVNVSNVGSGDLNVKAINWIENTNNIYQIIENPSDPFFENVLEAGESKPFVVSIEPATTGSYLGAFRVESDDINKPYDEIIVSAIAVDECPSGMQPDPMDPVRCIVKCTPGEHVCGFQVVGDDPPVSSWGHSECQSDGATLGDFISCANLEVCKDGVCVERPCDPGETICEDLNHQRVCDENGLWGASVSCVTEETCKPVECRVRSCQEYLATEGTDCDDGNKCTENGICNAFGACVSQEVQCDKGNPCVEYDCLPDQGCIETPDDSAECSDDNLCTKGDRCQGGQCIAGALDDCDDDNDCTDDFCDAVTGCYHENNTGECDDKNVCTTGDYCLNGECQIGPDVNDCDRGNPCERGICQNPGGCSYSFEAGPCSDGDPCTVNDYCNTVQGQNVCVPGPRRTCNDSNPCTEDTCDESGNCLFPALEDGVQCTDENACTGISSADTTLDHCEGGYCVPGTSVDCEDDNICTTNWCDEDYGCRKAYNSDDCSDNNKCTIGDKCSVGVCEPGTGVLSCDDGSECTSNQCDAELGCIFPPDDSQSCSDDDLCTIGDYCSNGVCVAGTEEKDCDDGNPCTENFCTNGACQMTVKVGESCDDGNSCTMNTVCSSSGVCAGGQPNTCDDGNPCTENYCIEGLGCQSTNLSGSHGSPVCTDGNPCTINDRCNAGTCIGGGDVAADFCDDGNPCTDNWCDPVLGCTGANDDTNTCSDPDPCSLNDYCSAGTCMPGNEINDCDDDNDCTTDSCVENFGCSNESRHGLTCEDGNLCTVGDVCNGTVCISGAADSCDDGNQCTDNVCNPDTGCSNPTNDSLSCNDSDGCTTGDHCESGQCVGEARNCSDGNDCTADICENGVCSNPYSSKSCDDLDPCTQNDWCVAGNCAGSEITCDDGNVCTDDACDSTDFGHPCDTDESCGDGGICENGQCLGMACYTTNNTADCSDGYWCQDNDYCLDGVCHAGDTLLCQDQCYAGCNEESNTCTPVANGTACDDGNDENYDDICTDGECVGTESFSVPGDCPGHSDMIKVLGTRECIDKYENEICRDSGNDCKGKGSDDYWICFDNYGGDSTCSNLGGGKPKAYSRAGKKPSRNMTYNQAAKACSNSGKRLCSVAEWELACTEADGRTYPWGNTWDETTSLYCNGSDYGDANGDRKARNTGSLSNCTADWGTFDMSGNVTEWTKTEGNTGSQRWRKGGDYGSGSDNMHCGHSVSHEWDSTQSYLGFRCCLSID